MNDKNRRYLESGQRCRQWIIDFAALIPVGSMFETKTGLLTTVVNVLEDLLGEVEGFVGEGLSATDVKGSERLDLLEIMSRVRDAARAAEFDHPGTRDRYRYTSNMSHQALLAAGRAFALGGATDEALIESYGAPNKWDVAVTLACDAFEASMGQQDSAVGSRVAKNAEVNAKMEEFITLKASVGHMVPNFCSGNPGAEIWVKLDGPPPTDEKECTFLTLDAATPYLAVYEGADAGKMAHYMFRWRMRDGKTLAWGETVSATITG